LSSRRSHLTLIVLLMAALAGVALLGVSGSPYHRSIKEGLDLQGGLEVVLQAKPLPGQAVTPAEMANSISIIRQRIDKLGVSQPVVTQQGANEINIELPAVHDPAQASKIIGQTAELDLYDLTPSLLGPSVDAQDNAVPYTSLFDLLTIVQKGYPGKPSAYDLFNSRTHAFITSDPTLKALKQDPLAKVLRPLRDIRVTVKTAAKTTAKGKKGATAPKTTTKLEAPPATTPGFPRGYVVLKVPARSIVVSCDSTVAVACPGLSTAPAAGATYYYLFKHGSYKNDPESPYRR
jgi:hypothetical protein